MGGATGALGWRSALFANPNTLSAMRTLTKSHTTILISNVFTLATLRGNLAIQSPARTVPTNQVNPQKWER